MDGLSGGGGGGGSFNGWRLAFIEILTIDGWIF